MGTGTKIRDAVKIVIERMREHPEEFEDRSTRFGWLYDADVRQLGLNTAETKVFSAALADIRYQRFHNSVLNSMLEGPDEGAILAKQQLMQVQGNSLKPIK